MDFYALILAAGKGTRMKDEKAPPEFPKVLRLACGRSLVSYVIDSLKDAGVNNISLIVGFGADYVRSALGSDFHYVVQPEQRGSGHAVLCARDDFNKRKGGVIVSCGDSPLFTAATISTLMKHHASSGAVIALVSAILDVPTGYGRIMRDTSGEIVRIVEEKCASSEEKSINEVNGGAYAFDSEWLWANINQMERNEAGEMNLTDLVRIATEQGKPISAIAADPHEIMGVNTPDDLRTVEQILRDRERV